ncbi:MAG: glycoside hydrolase family 11 protein [Fibrobacter sp.]|nr:glycoside hydrolase family 11 protein [Fibrobacter sp.]
MKKVAFFTKLVLGLGLVATGAFAQDFCNTSHTGNPVVSAYSVSAGQDKGDINDVGNYSYEQWTKSGNVSAKFYPDGSFSCTFSDADDYLCREGILYGKDSGKNPLTVGQLNVDFSLNQFTNAGGISYAYVGVYGWMQNPLIEWYIVDNWGPASRPNWLGTNKGTITIDGVQYDVYINSANRATILGTGQFDQIYSLRKTARTCGSIDVTAHFNAWKNLGITLGSSLYEVKVLGEAGQYPENQGASGSIDFNYAKVYVGNAPTPSSSASQNPTSSASPDFGNQTPYSSNSIPGTIEIENFDEGANGEAYNEVDGSTESGEPQGGSYRPDVNVDIVGVGSGYGVGYTNPDEWLEYTVDIPTGGTYNATIMIANGNASAAEVSLMIDGNSVGSISAASTDDGKWQVFAEASTTTPIRLPQGRHILRVSFPYCNADWLKFELVEADPSQDPSKDPEQKINTRANLSLNQPIGKFQVFDMQGKLLGYIDMARGNSMQNLLKQKFHKSGVYLVRQGDLMRKIAVR